MPTLHRPSLRLARQALAAVALLAPGAARAQVQDASFETGAATANSFTTYGTGQTFGSWTVSLGSVDLINGYWMAKDGTKSLDLSGSSRGGVYQDVATTPGTAYALSFWMAGNGADAKSLQVFFGGNLVGTFGWTGDGSYGYQNMEWQQRTASGLIATGATTRLEFVSLVEGASGPALDLVSLTPLATTATPEPATFALVGGGLLGVVGVARRRRAV
jgi:choice-of-anchor C domain-containing protein